MKKEEAIKQIIEDRMEDIMDCPFIYECEQDNCWTCGLNEAYAMALDALFRERNSEAKLEKRNELKAKGK